MTTQTATPATKAQLDALIDLVLEAGMNEAAGLMRLGSDMVSDALKPCNCFEVMGDNGECPKHGGMFKSHGAFSDAEIKADYQELNDLYNMGMGA